MASTNSRHKGTADLANPAPEKEARYEQYNAPILTQQIATNNSQSLPVTNSECEFSLSSSGSRERLLQTVYFPKDPGIPENGTSSVGGSRRLRTAIVSPIAALTKICKANILREICDEDDTLSKAESIDLQSMRSTGMSSSAPILSDDSAGAMLSGQGLNDSRKVGRRHVSLIPAIDRSLPTIMPLEDTIAHKISTDLRSLSSSSSTIAGSTAQMTGINKAGSIMKMAKLPEALHEGGMEFSRARIFGEAPSNQNEAVIIDRFEHAHYVYDIQTSRIKQQILVRTGNRFIRGYIRKRQEQPTGSVSLTSSSRLGSARPLTNIRCRLVGHGPSIYLNPSSFLVLPRDAFSTTNPLHVGEPVIARIVDDHYSTATVLGGYKDKIFVRFAGGGCNLVAITDIIRNVAVDAEKLPVVRIPQLESNKMAGMIALASAAEFVLAVLLLLVKLPIDYTMKDDAWLNILQPAAALLSAILSVKCLYLSFSLTVEFNETTQWLATYKTVVLCFLDIISLSAPSLSRGLIVGGGMLLRGGQLIWLYMHPKMAVYWVRTRREIAQSFIELRGQSRDPICNSRETLHRKSMVSWKYFGIVSASLVLFFGLLLLLELWRLITNQNPMLDLSQLATLRDTVRGEQLGQGLGGAITGAPTGLKAFLVILDGMRADHLNTNADFHALLMDPALREDLMIAPMRVQLPSMSVPNWLTFITGSPPWMTGVVGNAAVQLSSFDSVFSLAFKANRTAGLTGSSWFGDLVESYLDLRRMDTNNAGFDYQQGVANSQYADTQRTNAVQQILSRDTDHDFYLAHFSDIDERGHHAGVTKTYNKLDTYNKAVSDKAHVVRQLFQEVDNKTVVIVVADHGHVDSGGHGGTNSILLSTFMLTYMKGAKLATRVPARPDPVDSIDVAATICALLGLPMPANNIGRINEELADNLLTPLARYDAYRQWEAQQRGLRQAFDSILGTSFYTPNISIDTSGDFTEAVATAYRKNVIPNAFILAAYAFFALVTICRFVSRTTGIDAPTVLLRGRRTGGTNYQSQDARAFKLAVLCGLVYHIMTFIIFIVAWRMSGKYDWDSTMIHHPDQIVRMGCIVIIPGTIIEYLLGRTITYRCQYTEQSSATTATTRNEDDVESGDSSSYHTPARSHEYTPIFALLRRIKARDILVSSWTSTKRIIIFQLAPRSPREGNVELATKIKLYSFMLETAFLLACLIFTAWFGGILKFVRGVAYIDAMGWQLRFRVLCLMFMGMPSLIGKTIICCTAVKRLEWSGVRDLKDDNEVVCDL